MIVIVPPIARRIVRHSRTSSWMPKPSLSWIAEKPALARCCASSTKYDVLSVKSGRIGLDAAAHRAAHQTVHRQAVMPALQIPQRDVDRAQRLDRKSLLAVIAAGCTDFALQLGCERVRTDQEWLVVVGNWGG